jgi:hypothetical protein
MVNCTEKWPMAPSCVVGSRTGEPSRDTDSKVGRSGNSVSPTALDCQLETPNCPRIAGSNQDTIAIPSHAISLAARDTDAADVRPDPLSSEVVRDTKAGKTVAKNAL